MQHPIAAFFLKPVDPITDNARDYFQKIKNPQDLGTIRHRLVHESYYRSVSEWERDMNCIWENCVIYNGEGSYLAEISHHMERLFRKMMVELKIKAYDGWIDRVNELFFKLDDNLRCHPPTLQRGFQGKKLTEPIDNETVRKLTIAVNELPQEDLLHIVQISMMNGALYDQRRDDGVIDFSKVNKLGLRKVIKYTKERYTAMQRIYPE